ncbi:glycosyltransferase family 4 protein [Paenibacillus sp. FSL W8-1187]|uniref:glycosyltransferase family 4 protein n=1 Tax=Paenibacillus sp. FSL W8-1187 TaxID=2975339 RepID=UPI0030D9553D
MNSLYYPDIIGGAEKSTKILAEALTDYFNVNVITTGNNSSVQCDIVNNVRVFRIPPHNKFWIGNREKKSVLNKILWHLKDIKNKNIRKEVSKIIDDIEPVLIHTQNITGLSSVVWSLAGERNIPLIHTLRDYSLFEPIKFKAFNYFFSLSTKWHSRHVNVVIGISNFILNKHLEKKFFSNATKHVIFNSIEGAKESLLKKEENQVAIISYFGQVERNKGVDILINAFNGIGHEAELNVFGTGNDYEEMRSKNLHHNNIVFHGKICSEQVDNEMFKSDLIIVPSRWEEPFGRVVIEAYNNGTPVIASNKGGIPEIILDSNHLFDVDNPLNLTRKINDFLDLSLTEKGEIINGCFEKSKEFRTEKMLKSHLEIYDQYLNNKEKSYGTRFSS